MLSALTGATWAAILPLGEAVALGEAQRRDLSYGRIRLWGSLAFILAAIGIGQRLEDAGPAIVLWSIAAAVACILGACILLPEGRSSARPAAGADFRRLAGAPEFLAFVAAAGLIQASHAVYYGFATLHWRAAGHGELVIGLLWAEGVVAEVVLFACAGALLRRLGPMRLLLLAGALTVARWALSALSTELAVLVPAQALHAASFGAAHLAAMHYLRDHTPPELHASAQGFYAAVGTALPFGLLTPLAGWLYAIAGGDAFWAMAALALAGTVLAAMLTSTTAPCEVISRRHAPALRRGGRKGDEICGLSSSATAFWCCRDLPGTECDALRTRMADLIAASSLATSQPSTGFDTRDVSRMLGRPLASGRSAA